MLGRGGVGVMVRVMAMKKKYIYFPKLLLFIRFWLRPQVVKLVISETVVKNEKQQ